MAQPRTARPRRPSGIAGLEPVAPSRAPRFELIARLAQMAATDVPLEALFDVAVDGVAEVLQHKYCKVLQLLPGGQEVKLVAGVGWKPGLVGTATVGTGQDSQAGYTLRSGAPVVVQDLRTEQRFWGPPLLREHGVVSGMSAVIPGIDGPWGVLGVHSTEREQYGPDEPHFVEAVAAVLGAAIARRRGEEDVERSRDQAARALQREERRSAELRGIIAAMGDGVLVFDDVDRLLLMNGAAETILEEHEIRSLPDLLSAIDLPPDLADQALVERRILGTDRWVEVATYQVGPDHLPAELVERHAHENRASTIAVIRDVTEMRAAREAREAFVGMLSHELRTPVTTIYGGAEILARQPDHPRRQEIAVDVRGEADRLRRMVENLLVLSRVERKALALAQEPVSLGRLVPAIVDAEQRHWPQHSIEVRIDPRVPTVSGDATYIEQVLRNYLGNAAKFSPEGSTIQVRVEAASEEVLVAVRDRGPGFPAEEATQLFDLFYRGSGATLTPGSGIGLFVTRKLVELMGGRVAARPLDEGGAEFSFTLPAYAD